jgi:hypothetical protein
MKLFESVIEGQLSRQGAIHAADYFSTTPHGSSEEILLFEGMIGDSLLSVAVNNFAVCSVFLKKIRLQYCTTS